MTNMDIDKLFSTINYNTIFISISMTFNSYQLSVLTKRSPIAPSVAIAVIHWNIRRWLQIAAIESQDALHYGYRFPSHMVTSVR